MTSYKTLWFKRRRYGWGWTPVTWQGWTALVAALLIVVADTAFAISAGEQPAAWQVVVFMAILIAVIAGLLTISYRHGPKPKWRSGPRPDDDPELDA